MAHSASSHDPHHDHGAADHGSHASYAKGFILSVILTAIPFALVMSGGFANPIYTVLAVVALAVVQIVVHMVYFLHMTSKVEEGWSMISMIFTVVVVVIMLSGSVWVMYHLTQNMMPQMSHDLDSGS